MTANRPKGRGRLGPSHAPSSSGSDQLHQTQAHSPRVHIIGSVATPHASTSAAAMCTPPPPKRNTAVLMLGFGVCCMAMCNATLGFMMFGERGVENRAKLRALLEKPRP